MVNPVNCHSNLIRGFHLVYEEGRSLPLPLGGGGRGAILGEDIPFLVAGTIA